MEAFLRKAQSAPSVAAVDHRGVAVTYGELSSLAHQFAGSIQEASSGTSPRVLLALPPSPSAYAAMIGSLIAGGTFCPVDVAGPKGRNAAVCRAFSPDIILYEGAPPPFLATLPVTTRRVDVLQPSTFILQTPAVERSEVAYVVFTSGTTGNPKGVKVGRQAFSYFLHVAQNYFDLSLAERWGQFSNLGHDLGVMDVFMSLTQGGTLVPLTEAERFRPATAIRDRRIAVWQSVPSVVELMLLANQLTSEHLAPLRVMSFCGEPLYPRQLEALFQACPGLLVFNTYGATETTGFNTINRLTVSNYTDSCEAGAVAIGDDVPGWSIHLRGGDTDDEGEIVVASEFLSLGYWQDEDRTRASFRQVQFSDSRSQRSYFTGDRGVRRVSGMYCAGRLDRQVKICGERIELDEVDDHLREAGFTAAYTILKDGELYSFVESVEAVDQELVRAHLKISLPFHGIPKSVQPLTSLPRNQNGKIDRDALAREVKS
jgi:D-alanine--poly(phosphoribitol) ligase subunit 1